MTVREGRKRGNPNWGQPAAPIANLCLAGETEFEKFVAELKLEPEQWPRSTRLRRWVQDNMSRRYVPEQLLKAYGFTAKIEYF